MVQTVELVLDEASEELVRAQWQALAAAALPSQARHTGATNRPHVTLAVAEELPAELEPALRQAVAALPLPVRLGALVCFGGRRRVLARLVVADRALLDLHAAVAEVVAGCPGPSPLTEPGRWTPHVTLARGLLPEQVGAALAVTTPPGCPGEVDGTAERCRRYDGRARVDWLL